MRSAIRSLVFLLFFLFAAPSSFANALLDEAATLFREGKTQQAYELLLERFEQNAGDPAYDYLLGLAAMDSGHPTQAVFAFERILDRYPEHSEARIELARAYYQLNELEASQQEFETVRDQVPPAVQPTIDKFLVAIRHASAPAQRHFEAFVQAGVGYDSNVNGATDTPTIILTGFGNIPVTLDDSGLEQESPVLSFDAGISYEEPVSEDASIYTRAYLTAYDPLDAGQFSTESLGGELGILMFFDSNLLRFGLTGQHFFIDEESNFKQGGVKAAWQHEINDNTRLSSQVQYLAVRYSDQGARNVNQVSAGITLIKALDRKGSPVLFAGISGGNEDEQDDTRPDLGRDYYGISTGLLYTLRSGVTALAGLGWQQSRYGAANPLFAATRRDDLYSISSGLIVDLNDRWAVRPTLKYTKNNSTLPTNDYSRWQAYVNLRRRF